MSTRRIWQEPAEEWAQRLYTDCTSLEAENARLRAALAQCQNVLREASEFVAHEDACPGNSDRRPDARGICECIKTHIEAALALTWCEALAMWWQAMERVVAASRACDCICGDWDGVHTTCSVGLALAALDALEEKT